MGTGGQRKDRAGVEVRGRKGEEKDKQIPQGVFVYYSEVLSNLFADIFRPISGLIVKKKIARKVGRFCPKSP